MTAGTVLRDTCSTRNPRGRIIFTTSKCGALPLYRYVLCGEVGTLFNFYIAYSNLANDERAALQAQCVRALLILRA